MAGSSQASPWRRRSSASCSRRPAWPGACGAFVGWVERIDADHHFVILDFDVTVGDDAEPRAGDDAADVAWVPLAEVAAWDGLVPGLLDFLVEHGRIAVVAG